MDSPPGRCCHGFCFFAAAPSSSLELGRALELWLASSTTACRAAPDSQSKAALHTEACISSANAEPRRGVYLAPTFSFRVTPQALAIFLRASFRARPLQSRSVVAAARISWARLSSLSAALNFAMTSSRDILSPADVEACSEAPSPDSGADVGVLCAPFPNMAINWISKFE